VIGSGVGVSVGLGTIVGACVFTGRGVALGGNTTSGVSVGSGTMVGRLTSRATHPIKFNANAKNASNPNFQRIFSLYPVHKDVFLNLKEG